MIKNNLKLLKNEYDAIKVNSKYGSFLQKGITLSKNDQCILLTQSKSRFKFSVYDNHNDFEVWIRFENKFEMNCDCNNEIICSHKISGLLQSIHILEREKKLEEITGYRYTRSGMIDRVLKERWQKANTANYRVDYSKNKFGEHKLFNEYGKEYKITLRDFEKETGYCSCPDFRTNKLETCKHLMYVYNETNNKPELLNGKLENYPFVEVYLNPRSDYRISWYYHGRIEFQEISELIYNHFGNSTFLPDEELIKFLGFLHEAKNYKHIIVRQEVYEKVDKIYTANMLNQLRTTVSLDFGLLNKVFDDNQKKRIEFATFKENVVIAGKFDTNVRSEVIASAVMKKEIIGFKNCMILCQSVDVNKWEIEIENFETSQNDDVFFKVIDYESIVSKNIDEVILNYDLLILDEAHRIRKYSGKPSDFISRIERKHCIVVTSIPLHHNLSDMYSVIGFADSHFLSPLWEFSFNHYYFDQKAKNKITGYFNLKELFKKLSGILIYGSDFHSESIADNRDFNIAPNLNEILLENVKESNVNENNEKEIVDQGIEFISESLSNSNIGEVLKSDRIINIDGATGEVTVKFKILRC